MAFKVSMHVQPIYQVVFDNLELKANITHKTHAQQIDWQYTADQRESSQPVQYENYLRYAKEKQQKKKKVEKSGESVIAPP